MILPALSSPGASVRIVNPQTDAIRRTATDDKGFYLVDGLMPASYNVVVSSPGLAELTVADVRLGVGEGRLLDLHLQPASVKESVSVVAESDSQVQIHTASIAATIGEEPLQNLPINGRMISNLYLLVPGSQLSAVLQMLARADTGALMCMGYSTMRGFAVAHGTIGELRVGQVPVRVVDGRGRRRYVGKIRVTECEMVGGATRKPKNKKKSPPYLSVGYGLCFGQNETKAISMGMVESALRNPDPASPASSQEFVLYHTECIEAYGFTIHLKLPHYVTFQSQLDNLRRVVKAGDLKPAEVTPAGEPAEEEDED